MRVGLRTQILAALLLVTLGGVIMVGFISLWSTRRVLADERYERVAADAALAGRRIARVLEGEPELEARRARLSAEWPLLQAAAGNADLSLWDPAGRPIWPSSPETLPSDDTGRSGALGGLAPHAMRVGPGARVALYARVEGGGGRPAGVVRLVVSIDESVDETLARAQRRVLLLGAINGLILLAAAAWILRTSVVRPVTELERAAGRVAEGDLRARVEVRGPGELGRLADAFERMTVSLREGRESVIRSEKLAGVGRLAAGVAHEVGNPLAAILGYVETLLTDTPERPIDPALRREMLARVRSETERIHHIIQELLDYSRPPREELEAVDVRRAVDAAAQLARAQARARSVELRVELPGDLPRVRASQSRLVQVLLNLLLNAADAMDGQGTVTVDARVDGARLVLGVSDQGPGVAAELRGKIFDPFFTTKDPGQGTGLGLSVSLAIVEGFGGTMWLAASERGARFEVALPLWQ